MKKFSTNFTEMKNRFNTVVLEAMSNRGEQAVWYDPHTYEWVCTGDDHDRMVENNPEKFGLSKDDLNWTPSSNAKWENPKYFAISNGWVRVDIFQKLVHIELDHLNGKMKDSLSHLAEKLSMRYVPGNREVRVSTLSPYKEYIGVLDDLMSTGIFESKINEEASSQIAGFAEHWWVSEYNLGDALDYDWERIRNYPLRLLGDDKESWIQWYKEERKMWFSDYGDNERFDNLEKYWKSNPDDPIFVVKQRNGNPIIIDGNHRVAISYANGKTTIDAYVGTPKDLKESAASYTEYCYWIGPDGYIYEAEHGHEEFMDIDPDSDDVTEQMDDVINSGWIRVTGDNYVVFFVVPPWSKKISKRVYDFIDKYIGLEKKTRISIENTKKTLAKGSVLEVLSSGLF